MINFSGANPLRFCGLYVTCLIGLNVANNLQNNIDLHAAVDFVNVFVFIACCFQMKPLDQHGFKRVSSDQSRVESLCSSCQHRLQAMRICGKILQTPNNQRPDFPKT